MSRLKGLLKDERGNGGGSIAVMSLVIISFIFFFAMVAINFFQLTVTRAYIKNGQDLANRAVYAELDLTQLAQREVFIDETQGAAKFREYLEKNLKLDSNYLTERDINLVGSVTILEFEIYNSSELPAVTPQGKTVDAVAVYSQVEITIETNLPGRFGTITFAPYLTTYIPDNLIKTYHP